MDCQRMSCRSQQLVTRIHLRRSCASGALAGVRRQCSCFIRCFPLQSALGFEKGDLGVIETHGRRFNAVLRTSGSSDRLGFKATSPADVLNFLNNPDGKCFLFPDNHMGPDILFFLQDEETKELILVTLQAKITQCLDARAWGSALDSITLQFFCTSNVCII
jgi:hypothetical protein